MIRVLVAEDSATVRELLVALLDADPEIQVVGQASNGREAVEMTRQLEPSLVTMDIHMPLMDGFEATREIMIETPTPIVIVSGRVDVREVAVSMQALSAGALAVLPKPSGPQDPDFEQTVLELVQTVKTMAHVKVVRHWRQAPRQSGAPIPSIPQPPHGVRCEVVAIVASTGGPAALHRLIAALPRDFPAPILVVQHIARDFALGLAAWLNTVGPLKVKLAEHGEPLAAGTVYIAPADCHLGVTSGLRIALSDAVPIGGFRPSGSFLFRSVAKAFGHSAVAVIMTGMGNDGVAGLRAVREASGRIVAQDEGSSVVFGMPAAAIEAGLADVVLPLAAIVYQLENQVGYEHGRT